MTDQTTAIQTAPKTGMERVKNYMLSPEVKERFTDMMGKDGLYYLNQVLIVVANSSKLQECTPQSILVSAMRAASLKLSVDPSLGEAWIIPYKNNKKGGVMEAQYQIGYKGVRELAMRTNKYIDLNVIDVYETDTLVEDRMTGNLSFVLGENNGHLFTFDPQKHAHEFDSEIVGYMLYFKLTNGFNKTFYMSKGDIADHAAHYATYSYNDPKSKWNDLYERPKMERKTVLINGLRRYGVFNPGDKATLDAIETEQGWIESAEAVPDEDKVTLPEPEPILSPEENKAKIQNLSDSIYGKETTKTPAVNPTPKGGDPVSASHSAKAPRPMQPATLKEALEVKATKYLAKPATEKQVNLVAMLMGEAFGGDEKIRHSVLKYLTGATSTKLVSAGMINALLDWLNSTQDSGGAYSVDPMSAKELQAVWTEALKEAGQGELEL